jgi:hypothetical protein
LGAHYLNPLGISVNLFGVRIEICAYNNDGDVSSQGKGAGAGGEVNDKDRREKSKECIYGNNDGLEFGGSRNIERRER